jgi:carboxyl-terminal processing protease
LEKYNNKEYSLNIVKYKQEQKQLKDAFKQIEDLSKLSAPLEIKNLGADITNINSSEDKIEKNKQWIKIRSTDIYIDECVRILDKQISKSTVIR